MEFLKNLIFLLKKLFKSVPRAVEEKKAAEKSAEQLKELETSKIYMESDDLAWSPSSIIAVDTEAKTVMVRTPQGYIPETEEVEIFSYGSSPIKFKTKVLAVRNGYLVLSVPLHIEDAQKRKHYRVNVRNEKIKANLIVMGRKKFETVPVDISIGGARLEISGKLSLARDALVTLCLELGDDPLLPIHMFVASSTIDANNMTTLRGSFYDVKPEQERTLSKWLLEIQRKNRK